MWQRATHNWNFFRLIRLALGVMITVQSFQVHQYWFSLVGILFATMAIFDMGCAGGSCAAPYQNRSNKTNDTDIATPTKTVIEYEEVHS